MTILTIKIIISKMTDIKLSRTQRAINAKDERYKKIELRMRIVQKKKKVLQEMVLKRLSLFSQILVRKKVIPLRNFQLPLIP